MAGSGEVVEFPGGKTPAKALADAMFGGPPDIPALESEKLLELSVRCADIANAIRHMKHIASKLSTPPPGESFERWGEDFIRYTACADLFKGAASIALGIEARTGAEPA